MRRQPYLLGLSIGFFLTASVSAQPPSYSDREIIVRLHSNPGLSFQAQSLSALSLNQASLGDLVQAAGGKSARALFPSNSVPASFQASSRAQVLREALGRTVSIELEESVTVEEALSRLAGHSDIEWAEPNYQLTLSATAPNDSLYGTQWGLKNTGQSGSHDGWDPAVGVAGRDIDAETAWDAQTGSAGTIVAVIDTGLDWDHPDITANLWSNADEALNSGDTDGNGFVDDVRGWDFGSGDNDPDDDCNDGGGNTGGHGTHVSGIVGAAGNNSTGVSGVNWTVSVMPVKVANSNCQIFTSALASAIVYAADNGAHVINMSLGGGHSAAMQTAVDYAAAAGTLLIASAGNSSTNDVTSNYPAAYDNVMAIAATDRNDQRALFSNYGTWITVSAPGVAVRSLYPVPQGSYNYLSGTSMSSPMTAGLAGLIKSEFPSLTAAQIKQRIIDGSEDISSLNPSFTTTLGAGRINAARSLLSVSTMSPSVGFNSAAVSVEVNGKSIPSGANVYFSRSGQSNIVGASASVLSSTRVTATVDITGAATGYWDVNLFVGGMVQTLSGGFYVETVDVTQLTPFKAPATSTATAVALTGVNFQGDMTVRLEKSGEPDIAGDSLVVVSSESATVEFNLQNAADGRWDLVIERGALRAVFPRAFAVTSSAFDVFTATTGQSHSFSLTRPSGIQTVNFPAGVASSNFLVDLDATPVLSAIDRGKDPYVTTGVGVELIPTPSTISFDAPYQIVLRYRDSDLPDPEKETALTIGYYNETTGRWEPLPSFLDADANEISAWVTHMSQFSLIQHVPSVNLDGVVPFPNPYRPDQGHTRVIFDFLTAGAQVRVYDLAGGLVRDLTDDDRDGQIIWDVLTEGGARVASGIYYYLVTDEAGLKKKGRLGVVR